MATSTSTLSVALFGNHSDAFMKVLQDKQFEVQYLELPYTFEAKGPTPSVLALAGNDYDLSADKFTTALKANTIIVAFAPSPTFLKNLHKATNTPIDIPNIKLPDGFPLVVYLANQVVHVAIHTPPTEARIRKMVNETAKTAPSDSFTVSVVKSDPTEQTVATILRAATLQQGLAGFANNLTPPADMIGFKRATIDNSISDSLAIATLAWDSDGKYFAHTSDEALIQKYDLNWYTDVYSYATGTECRDVTSSQFTKNGGVVYTLAIERGNMQRTSGSPPRYLGPISGYCGYYFCDYQNTGTGSDNLQLTSYQPTGPSSVSGTSNSYSISFEQEMQMFNDDGHTRSSFKIQYSESYTLDKFEQHSKQNGNGANHIVTYNDYYDRWDDPDFDTEKWWNPGVYEWVNREGKGYWIVKYLPPDNLPIHGLTVYSSSVGQYTLKSYWQVELMAFKSRAWRCSTDDDKIHFTQYSTNPTKVSSTPLDLTWSKN